VVKVKKCEVTTYNQISGVPGNQNELSKGHFWLLSLFLVLLTEHSLSAQTAQPQLKLKQQPLGFNDRNRNLVSLVVADDY
jgi:hypothetical protein